MANKEEQPIILPENSYEVTIGYIKKIFISLIGSFLICAVLSATGNQAQSLKFFNAEIFRKYFIIYSMMLFILFEVPKIIILYCLFFIGHMFNSLFFDDFISYISKNFNLNKN